MRLKTIFIIFATILLTVMIMQNNDQVYFKILFFTTRTSKLLMMLVVAILAFIIGYMAGKPKRTMFNTGDHHGYNEQDDQIHEGLNKPNRGTLSDEDREYIS